MKQLIMILSLISLPYSLFSQLEIKIKELKVSYINVKLDKNVIREDIEKGPYINLLCSIKNNSGSKTKLYPSKSKFYIVFNFNDRSYEHEVIALSFADNDTLDLEKDQFIEVTLGTNLLLGTPILKKNKGDYTLEMLQILPTVRVIYIDKENIKVKSNEIVKVIIN